MDMKGSFPDSGVYAPKTGTGIVVFRGVTSDSGAYAPSRSVIFAVLFVLLPLPSRKGIWQEKQKE